MNIIVQEITKHYQYEIFEDYKEILNSIQPSEFISRWNQSGPEHIRKEIEY